MKVRFPKRRADGSFDMIIEVAIPAECSPGSIGPWLLYWAMRRAVWVRYWQIGDRTEPETHRMAEDFFGSPEVVLQGERVTIKWLVRPGSKRWKDWGAELYADLRAEFPGLTLLGIKSEIA